MKRLLFILLFLPVIALAQGSLEWDENGAGPVDGFAPATITKYTNAAGNTKILIPLATTVTKFCIQPTAATGIRYGITTGAQKAVAANAELCRTVRKGVTQLQYSSTTSGTAIVELQF